MSDSNGAVGPDYDATPVLAGRGLSKRYGRVTALSEVDIELYPGEILAVVGDNGAGKSTLIKLLSGAAQPDDGAILMDGKPVTLANPLRARDHGIETVYQDLAVAPALDVASNLFLGREKRMRGPAGWLLRKLDTRGMQREAREQLAGLKVGIPSANRAVETLSGGQRQAVAVARAVSWGNRVVIMDEPTAALGVQESAMVLELVRTVRSRGIPVILVSHSMPEVFEVADRVQVMRLGRRAGSARPGRDTMDDVVAMITGARVGAEHRPQGDGDAGRDE